MILGTSYLWNHMICVFLCLANCTKHNVFKFYSWCKYHNFITFYGWVIFLCVCVTHFVYPWTLGLFWLLWIIYIQMVYTYLSLCFPSLRCKPRRGIGISFANSVLIFWGTSILFFTKAAAFYIPTLVHPHHILTNTCYFLSLFSLFFLYNSHPNECEVISFVLWRGGMCCGKYLLSPLTLGFYT